MKNRLIELLNEATFGVNENTLADYLKKETIDRVADYLLANGVIVPPCKVGDTVWVYNKSTRNIYKNTVVGVKIFGESKYKNGIIVEYKNQYKETSTRKFTWAQVGKQVFLTEEEAIDALTKGLNDERKD